MGQFSFGHLQNIFAWLEIIWFSRRLFCSSPATSCKAVLLRIGCFGQAPQVFLLAILAHCFKGCFGLGAMSQEARKKWERLGPGWQERFLLDPADPSKGSWLDLAHWMQSLQFSWTQRKFSFIWCEHSWWLAGSQLQEAW